MNTKQSRLLLGITLLVTALVFMSESTPAQSKPSPQKQTPSTGPKLGVENPTTIGSATGGACCRITSIDSATGLVTAKVTSTSKSFQFTVKDAALLNSLRVGQGVFANFNTQKVSVDGAEPCCQIVSLAQPGGGITAAGQNLGNAVNPVTPCCNITSIDAATGTVTAKVNSTGKTFQFAVKDAALLNSLRVGQGVFANFKTQKVSVDGAQPCCSIVSLAKPGGVGITAAGQNLGNSANPAEPCCSITSINRVGPVDGIVTAKVNATGQTFQFAVKDAGLLKSLQVGRAAYANFKTHEVSFDGKTAAGTIVSLGPVDGAKPLGPVDGARPVAPVDGAKPVGPVDGVRPVGPVDGAKPVGLADGNGPSGSRGPQDPRGLTSFNDLNGMPCSIGNTAGTIALTFASNGVATLTCNLNSAPLTSDGINNTFGTAVALGTLNCGQAVSSHGTTFPAGTEDWFVFTWSNAGCPTSTLTLTLRASSGIVYDVKTSATTNVVNGFGVPAMEVPNTFVLVTSGTYYVRIYGATPAVTGTWAMAIGFGI